MTESAIESNKGFKRNCMHGMNDEEELRLMLPGSVKLDESATILTNLFLECVLCECNNIVCWSCCWEKCQSHGSDTHHYRRTGTRARAPHCCKSKWKTVQGILFLRSLLCVFFFLVSWILVSLSICVSPVFYLFLFYVNFDFNFDLFFIYSKIKLSKYSIEKLNILLFDILPLSLFITVKFIIFNEQLWLMIDCLIKEAT